MKKLVFLVSILFWFIHESTAQCCSPGNPIGGTSNVGTLKKGGLRTATFFRYSYADTFYEKNKKSEFQDTKANFSYLGQSLAFGLWPQLTLETELGFFITKTRHSEVFPVEKASGLSNALISMKYSLWKDEQRHWELTAGAGYRFPFSRKLKESADGYPVSMDVQPSTGATGFVGHFFIYKGFLPQGVRLFLVNRFEVNGKNDIGYQYGNTNHTSFFISKSLDLHWTAILQLRNEWRDYDYWDDIFLANTGGNVAYLSPQINYTLAQTWNISVLFEIPIFRDYNLSQLGTKYAVALNVVRDFDLNKKMTVPN